MKQFLCIACALGCMVFLSCVKKDSNPTAVPSVFISEVRTVSGVSATTFTGKTKAVSEVNLAFRVAGQIERILVKEGDYVKKGQIVAAAMDGKLLNAKETEVLADLPSKEELYAKMLGCINSPATGIAGAVNAVMSGLVRAMDQVAKQKSA